MTEKRWFACSGCPFRDGETEEATMAQNLGCLPTPNDMLKLFDDQSIAMSCHGDESIPCIGLSLYRNTDGAKILKYADWYKGDSK